MYTLPNATGISEFSLSSGHISLDSMSLCVLSSLLFFLITSKEVKIFCLFNEAIFPKLPFNIEKRESLKSHELSSQSFNHLEWFVLYFFDGSLPLAPLN